MKTYTFPHGGILFEDSSAPARDGSVLSFLPWISVIPLIQQNGVSSVPIVKPGDTVKEGMLIAKEEGKGSANIHSPVPGKVLKTVNWNLTSQMVCNALVVRMEGSFSRLGKDEKIIDWENFSSNQLKEVIKKYGIVEMDGYGVPVSDIFADFRDLDEPISLVVRCVFDDPWLVADYDLCKERINELAEGAFIAAKAVGAEKIVLAVSAPDKKIGEDLLSLMSGKSVIPVSMVCVGSRYPQRNKRELEIVLRQYEKRERDPLGAMLFLGPATICAIYDAVCFNKPILERYVAAGGSAVRNPRVLKVRIGSRLEQVFEECGGFVSRPKRTAIGSPLIGRSVVSLDEPVTASTFAVFAVGGEKQGLNPNPRILELRYEKRKPEEKEKEKQKEKPLLFKLRYAGAEKCISCGECRLVCPVSIDPEKLYKVISEKESYKDFNDTKMIKLAMQCHGCGCCEAVCPSCIPLSRAIINAAEFKTGQREHNAEA
jgi:electron transport complex protein RnfC